MLRGTCMAGRGGHCSRYYASYWNAFLVNFVTGQVNSRLTSLNGQAKVIKMNDGACLTYAQADFHHFAHSDGQVEVHS